MVVFVSEEILLGFLERYHGVIVTVLGEVAVPGNDRLHDGFEALVTPTQILRARSGWLAVSRVSCI